MRQAHGSFSHITLQLLAKQAHIGVNEITQSGLKQMAFKSAFSRLANAFATPARHTIERDYLNSSISMADLERRQREIDRGKFRTF